MNSSNQKMTAITHHHQLMNLVIKSVSIPRELKSLLIAISSFYNLKNDNAFPTRKLLSERTGYSVNYITHLIAKAVKQGYLKVQCQFRQVEGEKSPRQTANIYQIVLSSIGGFYCRTKTLQKSTNRKKKNIALKSQEHVRQRTTFVELMLGKNPNNEVNSFAPLEGFLQIE